MALIANKFTRLFHNKKRFSSGVRRDNLSIKCSSSGKTDEDSKDELETHGISHVKKIKCFECGKPWHITVNSFSKKEFINKHTTKAE